MKFGVELGHFKKIREDNNSATLRHPQGHEIRISKQGLNPKLRTQLSSLPKHMADGGDVADLQEMDAANNPQNNPQVDNPSGNVGPQPASQPQQQIPAGPENPGTAMPGVPNQYDMSKETQAGFGLQQQGLNAKAAAEQDQAHEKQAAAENIQNQLQQIENKRGDYESAYMAERLGLLRDIKNSHIDPDHYMENKSVPGKIATAIGLIMGGIGGGLTHQGNPALEFLNAQIGRDMQAQQANLGKKESLLSANIHHFGEMNQALNMTKANMLSIYSSQLDQAAAKAADPIARARLQQASGQLKQQEAQTVGPMFQRQAIMQQMNQGGSQFDPAQAVRYLVPEPHQKAVFDEISRAQDTRRMSDSILKSFDQAAHDNTVLRTGAGLARTPASVLSLHQSMQPTFKDLEGTVRQAAMDNTFKNITPQPGDMSSTIATKRAALEDYLQSKRSAPTAKGFGINLDNFQSTAPAPKSAEVKTMGGVQYKKVQGGWQKV